MMNDDLIALRKQIIQKDFNKMNAAQAEAVFHVEGPLLVLAGAGSGKTTVIINRIANLIKYGNAYNSYKIDGIPTEKDINLLRSYLNNEGPDLSTIQHLLRVEVAMPWQILAITFTNKAANELKERLQAMLGENAGDIWASTFHAACSKILRRHANLIGYKSHFTIYDTDDSKRTMKECQRVLGIDDKMLSHKTILSAISKAKDMLITPEEYKVNAGNDIKLNKIAEAYAKYQTMLKTADAMDFDDIIVNTVLLFENNPSLLNDYQQKFKYIMVDEYQDTNYAQYVLISLLASLHKNLCVVGDDDQSIYRFRGATIENILNFETQYKKVKTIRLERNYRSTQTILDAANSVIAHNENRKGKKLWTENGTGDQIALFTAYDEQEEGRHIADVILKSFKEGSAWSEHAVLYRMNAQSNVIENAFVRSGIPYRVIGGHRFYERKEIRDSIAYLSVVNNPADNARLRRIINEPKRGIGDSTIHTALEIANALEISLYDVIKTSDHYQALSRVSSKLLAFSAMLEKIITEANNEPLYKLFEIILRNTGYIEHLATDPATFNDRVSNLNELSNNLIRYSEETENPDLNGFLEDVALITDIDNYNTDTNAVVMMTIHSAKGLEFPFVFIPGLEEGIFPSAQSTFSQTDTEEERRLAYVAITRAKKRLYLTNARTRLLYGSTSRNPVSRFINEIPPELIEQKNTPSKFPYQGTVQSPGAGSKRTNRGFSKPSDTSEPAVSYTAGDTVIHSTFGQGVLLSAQRVGNDTLLEIAFEKTGTKKLMAKFAKLQKLP